MIRNGHASTSKDIFAVLQKHKWDALGSNELRLIWVRAYQLYLSRIGITDEGYAVEVAALSVDYNIALRLRYAESVGGFGMDWQALARPSLANVLSRPIGRDRFGELGRPDAPLREFAEQILAAGDVRPCAETSVIASPASRPSASASSGQTYAGLKLRPVIWPARSMPVEL